MARDSGSVPRRATRALFLTHAFPRSEHDPVGSFVLRLAVALRAHGIESEVLAPAAAGLVPTDTIEGIAVSRYRYAPRRWESLAYTGTMSSQARDSWSGRAALAGLLTASFAAAHRRLRMRPFDLVHAHWWFPGGLVGSWLRRTTGIPLVTTMHGSDIRLARAFPGGRRGFRYVARSSAALTTVSSWLAREAREFEPSCHPIVAPMPVVADLFHPGGHRIPNRLLFVGKLSEQKGIHHLLRALPLMRSAATIDVVGAGRIDDSQFRALAAELGVASRINWLPLLSQRELAELYRRAVMHVIPAIDEGLGLTAVESLLCETPVVAFASGGVTDVVLHERTGLLVPPGDAVALAAALDRLLMNDTERAALGVEGRAFALSHFSPDAVASQYAAIYDGVIEHRSK